MNYLSTLFLLTYWLLTAFAVQAQEPINPNRVRWTASLPANTTKSLVDAGGNTWSLSGSGTFQVVDSQGKLRWSKQLTSLTVADFTVDARGQLLLVGLPATGRPVLEKYDASQTLAWRNTLDSLSNAADQANKLSVVVGAAGSGIVLGLNATSDRTLSYYFFQAGGKLGSVVSLKNSQNSRLIPDKPVVYNQNTVLISAAPVEKQMYVPNDYYKLRVDSLSASRPTQIIVVAGAQYESIGNSLIYPGPRYGTQFVWQLRSALVGSQYVYLPLQYSYTKGGSGSDSASTAQRFIWTRVSTSSEATSTESQYSYYALDDDRAAVFGATSQLADLTDNIYTTQAISTTTANRTTTDLLLNRYLNAGLKRLETIKLGTATSANGGVNTVTLLRANPDGSVLLSGITSGTMTIGQATFTGTPSTPVRFLLALDRKQATQALSAEQVSWTTSLPATTRRIRSNARQQSWVQLPDSTFRLYDATGKQIWQKQLPIQRPYDFGADLKANLYVADLDTVSCFDSTGALRWKYGAGYKGSVASYTRYRSRPLQERLLAIKPGGGGVVASMDFVGLAGSSAGTELTADSFDAAGKSLGTGGWIYFGYFPYARGILRSAPVQTDNRAVFTVDEVSSDRPGSRIGYITELNTKTGKLMYYADEPGGYPVGVVTRSTNEPVLSYATIRWAGSNGSDTYALVDHRTLAYTLSPDMFFAYGFIKYDSTGKKIINEVNTPRVNTLALSKARAVSPNGTLFAVTTTPSATTNVIEVTLNEHAPNLDLRNTTRFASYTVLNTQTDQTSWEIVQAYADGSILLSGVTNGTLTIGANTYVGTTATPSRFLTLVRSTVAQITAAGAVVCSGSPAMLQARYKGYLTQAPVIELATAAGTLVQRLTVPLSQSALVDSTLSSVSLPIPTTLAAGTYQVRTVLGSLVSPWSSLTVLSTPAKPQANQQAGELVATGSGTAYQWYDAQNRAIAGATNSRIRPLASATYFVTTTANGCASPTSDPINFVVRNVVQAMPPTTAVCTGTTLAVGGRYQGYFVQQPVVQIASVGTSFSAVQASASVPLTLSATSTDTVMVTTPLLIPTSLAAGTYQLRILSEAPQVTSGITSLSVLATPAAPTTRQEGDELVASITSGTFQWYDGQRQAISGATSSRFRPQTPGTYYAVNTLNGCTSAFSAAATVVFLATEPAPQTITVYPNPASDRLHVRWPGAGAGAQIQVLNSQGRVLQRVARQGELTDVSLTGLSADLLMVHLQEDGQPTRVYKVVLQRP